MEIVEAVQPNAGGIDTSPCPSSTLCPYAISSFVRIPLVPWSNINRRQFGGRCRNGSTIYCERLIGDSAPKLLILLAAAGPIVAGL